jgi:hypothetical protein
VSCGRGTGHFRGKKGRWWCGFLVGAVGLAFLGGVGLLLVVAGNVKASVLLDSECRGKVGEEAKACPHCGVKFDGMTPWRALNLSLEASAN